MKRRVEVRIDRLVLHGVPPGEREAFAAAVERGLSSRIAARLAAGRRMPRDVPNQVAEAIHRGLKS